MKKVYADRMVRLPSGNWEVHEVEVDFPTRTRSKLGLVAVITLFLMLTCPALTLAYLTLGGY